MFDQLKAYFPDIHDSLIYTASGVDDLPSWFAVSDLAENSFALNALLLQKLRKSHALAKVDRRLASLWFGWTLRPQGWKVPPPWDPIAGDYRTQDGWIRLHTNAPHHRDAALKVMSCAAERDAVEKTVAKWDKDALESAIVEAGGCAAAMRSLEDWQAHPQGMANNADPLVHWEQFDAVDYTVPAFNPSRPLAGLKVLDMTRVLAGPVAGRFLAAFGAKLLRIDPPGWEEPAVIPEISLGKRCATMDVKTPDGRETLASLVREADILLHGYRPGAMAGLGFGREELRQINPRLIDVSLCAYGWSGPWADRRGFDSLVQMSSGIAAYGMRQSGSETPSPLPVQALDMAAGYLIAASALQALIGLRETGVPSSARTSLAGVAHLLSQSKRETLGEGFDPLSEADIDPLVEQTDWGPAQRVRFPLALEGVQTGWDEPAHDLHTAPPKWWD